MGKISVLNRILLLGTGILAGYKVVGGMQTYSELTTFYYTVAFGMIVLASLLLILFGFEILNSDGVLILAALIPVGLSIGLISQFLPKVHTIYLIFSTLGMAAVTLSRLYGSEKMAVITLSLIHGISGIIVVWLPLVLVINGTENRSLLLVTVGSIIMGIEGILLALLKIGKPVISEQRLYKNFPLVLFCASAAFVAGLFA